MARSRKDLPTHEDVRAKTLERLMQLLDKLEDAISKMPAKSIETQHIISAIKCAHDIVQVERKAEQAKPNEPQEPAAAGRLSRLRLIGG